MPLKRVPNTGADALSAAIAELEQSGATVGDWLDYGNEWLIYYRMPAKPGPKPQVRG